MDVTNCLFVEYCLGLELLLHPTAAQSKCIGSDIYDKPSFLSKDIS